MAVVISDLFNRADSTTTLGVADTGQAWTALRGTWGISSSQAYTPNNVDAVAVIDAGVTDATVQMTYPVANSAHYMVLRCVDADNYLAVTMGSSGGSYQFYKREVGVLTSLAVGTGGSAAGDVITVELVGSTITVKRAGVTLLTATSTLFQTATKYGMATSSNTRRFDSFSVSTAAPALARVGQDAPLAWAVRAAIGRDAPLAWSVRAAVNRALTVAWQIRQAAGRDAPLGWTVESALTRVGRDAPLGWILRGAVFRSSDVRWHIRGAVARSAPLTWQIRVGVFRPAPLGWLVRGAVARDAPVGWHVRQTIGHNAAIVWQIQRVDGPVTPGGRLIRLAGEIRGAIRLQGEQRLVIRLEGEKP